MDLEVLMEAWTKGCIEMSEIIILLLSFLRILGPNASTICLRAEQWVSVNAGEGK